MHILRQAAIAAIQLNNCHPSRI